MNKRYIGKTHERRLRKFVMVFFLSTIILTVSTYAWFIGMKTVDVSAFDVEIAAVDGLALSLTGKPNSWTDVIVINEENYKTDSYEGNTNSWGGDGLIPMSTVGVINPETSRLTMYEKGSFTTTPGGYRVMASEVLNKGSEEANGYVAFDLFIRNLSGNAYYQELRITNEEAIYLTKNSEVKVAVTGNNEENSGIENSVRVAFAQIGRVKSNTNENIIRAITCDSDDVVTGICEDRNATIWEPNDDKHVQNALNWYDISCKKRIDADLTKEESYTGSCKEVNDGDYVPTYAVSGVIDETDRVDAYDGELNGYTGSISSTPSKGKLMKMSYFTDTMKNLKGTERPELMMLAPNSVTKVRIYVYLEGQDIDNYDFASLGKRISVSFGFTKERFHGEDVDYNVGDEKGPSLEEPVNELLSTYVSSLCTDSETCSYNSLITDVRGNLRYSGTSSSVGNKVYYNCENKDNNGYAYGSNYYDYENSCEVWRMIGVFSDDGSKRVKIINTSSTFNAVWDSSSSINSGMGINQWGESTLTDGSEYKGADLMQLLNGYYIGKSGSECKYCSSNYQDTCSNTCDTASNPLSNYKMKPLTRLAKRMIEDATWSTYGVHSNIEPLSFNNSEIAYLQELGVSTQYDGLSACVGCDPVLRATSWTGLVGLMSVSDSTYANGWLNSSSNPWTITPYIYSGVSMPVWRSKASNAAGADPVFTSRVWPVVYLNSSVKVIDGDGFSKPYRLGV